jgi:DNA invertase Pin-like site-specific DNA recombinase
MNDFLITILSAVAEFERSLISERVKDGIERAKRQGIKIGRKSVLEKKNITIEDLKKLREQGYSYRQIAIRTGIKFSTIYKILNQNTELNKLNNK